MEAPIMKEKKLMAAAIHSGTAMIRTPIADKTAYEGMAANFYGIAENSREGSTGYRPGFSEAGSSGTYLRKSKLRKRPPKKQRTPKTRSKFGEVCETEKKERD